LICYAEKIFHLSTEVIDGVTDHRSRSIELMALGAVRAQAQGGGFAYVANCGSLTCPPGGVGGGNVSAYTINGPTGALTPAASSPFPGGGFPL
jgi:hypothetical protein